MKKIILAFIFTLIFTLGHNVMAKTSNINIRQDINEINLRKSEFAALENKKELKEKELFLIDREISEKENQIKRILENKKLSDSQKKAKTSLLQKDIETLKIKKANINK